MRGPIYDYENGEYIYPTSGSMGYDSDGHFHMRMGGNLSIDMETGELHMTSGWDDDEDDD